jgi:Putative beta-barrel porin 2
MIDSPEARKRLGRTGSTLLFSLLTLALAWSPAVAVDLGEWVPGLKLTTFLSERVEYETNIFQVPSHSQGDVIFWTIPGIVVDYTAGSHSLSAGYRAEILNYATLTAQNNTHHMFSGQLRLEYPRTLITVTDSFARTSEPPGTELSGPIESTTNALGLAGQYRLTPTFSVGLSSSWVHQSFDESSIGNLINRDEYLAGASVFWKVLPKTDLSLNYYHGWTTFTEASDRNYTSNGFTVGLNGRLTAKLSSTMFVGYTLQNADNSNQVAYSGWVTGGGWTYTPTEKTTISLSTLRATQASTDGSNPYYVTTSAFLSAGVQVLPKVTVNARLGGGVNDYPTKDTINGKTDWRQDSFGVAGVGITYAIQPWLSVGLDYLRTSRDSNFSSFNFVDERISGRVTVQF